MKVCKTCGTDDPTLFYETQGSSYCRVHHKEKYFIPGRERLLQAKLARAQCADCGLFVTEDNACAFDFDHLPPRSGGLSPADNKAFNVSNMTTMSQARFEAEIEKCELVCANDHRLRTKTRPRVQPYPGRPRRVPLSWAPF